MSNLMEVPTEELLSFQDYPVVHQQKPNELNQDAEIDIVVDNGNMFKANTALEESTQERTQNIKSIWTLDYYQQFFEVDTKDVKERILASIIPSRNNTLKQEIKEKPDLYGPFWISTTLIFTIAISGNIANYLQHKNNYHWKYDFKLVSYAASAIWSYIILIPLFLWAILKMNANTQDFNEEPVKNSPSFLELICIYGYSLFIYIPVSVLWTIQISSLQWFLVLSAVSLSGTILLLTLMSYLKLSKHKIFLICTIIVCHVLLATGFKLYFFHIPYNLQSNIILNSNASAVHV